MERREGLCSFFEKGLIGRPMRPFFFLLPGLARSGLASSDFRYSACVPSSGEITLRVRYCECDPMGVAHHSVFPVWFEMGRTELLRETGISYRDLETKGFSIAVVRLSMAIRRPARYDDVLRLRTTLIKRGHIKLDHEYSLYREDELLATGSTVLVCLDRQGRAQPLPGTLCGDDFGS